MKRLGMIGGVGPESTIDYYRSIISSYRQQKGDGSYPSIVINSIDVNRLLNWMAESRLAEVAAYLIEGFRVLTAAGATFGLISANTPHLVFEQVQREASIPLISIVDVTLHETVTRGFQTVGLLATRFTVNAGFYQRAFSARGLTVVTPTAEEQEWLHGKYVGELLQGIFLTETRRGVLSLCERLVREHGAQALILGGTELPLLFADATVPDVPFLNTTELHVKAAVAELLK